MDRWEKMKAVMAARAADMADVPGGASGLLVRQYKQIGKVKVEEYAVDTGLLRELRAHERQAAQELGQWMEKSDTSLNWSGDLADLTPEQLTKLSEQARAKAFPDGDPAAIEAAKREGGRTGTDAAALPDLVGDEVPPVPARETEVCRGLAG
jgi:hypothetical protein